MRYNVDGPHVLVSSRCAGAIKALLINLSVQQSPQKTHTHSARRDLHEPPKILWRSCLLFSLPALLCLRGSRVEQEHWATPPMSPPPDTLIIAMWIPSRISATLMKIWIHQRWCRVYHQHRTYHNTSIWKMLMHSVYYHYLDRFHCRTWWIHQQSPFIYSFSRSARQQRGFLSLCLTGRWHQRALGQLWGWGISSSSSKIKKDFDGIIPESRPLPTHCHCHTTGDFHFPVIEFLSRFFVLWWSSDEVPPSPNLIPTISV